MADRTDTDLVETGFPEIDHQHQRLIDGLNHLIAGILTGENTAITLAAFDKICELWQNHCQSEEKVLESQGSPRVAVMKAEHDRILRRLEGFRRAFAEDPEVFRAGTDVGEIRRLAIRHFRQYDKVEFDGLRSST